MDFLSLGYWVDFLRQGFSQVHFHLGTPLLVLTAVAVLFVWWFFSSLRY